MIKYLMIFLILLIQSSFSNTVTNNPFVNSESNNQIQSFENSENAIEEKDFLGLEDINITGIILSNNKKLLLIQYNNGNTAILALNDQVNENLKVHQIYLEEVEFTDLNNENIFTLDFRGNIKNISEGITNE